MLNNVIRAKINFDDVLREWDGFGFNYVQVCQTTEYEEWPQNSGGFSILSPAQRQEILDMIFTPLGLMSTHTSFQNPDYFLSINPKVWQLPFKMPKEPVKPERIQGYIF